MKYIALVAAWCVLASSAFAQVAVAPALPVGIPGVTVAVPPLRNPSSPNCPHDIDASSCLQAAINAGDIQLPGGSYIVHGVHVPSDRRIAGVDDFVTLRNPLTAGSRGHTDSTLILNHASNVVISNLTFTGSNDPITPNAQSVFSAEFVFLIAVDNGSSGNLIANSRFQGAPGDAAIELYGANVEQADNENVIAGNTFSSCASYAVAVVDGNDNQIIKNWFKDCSLGSEMDAPTAFGVQTSSGNHFSGNVFQNVNGQPNFLFGATGRHNPFVTGGAAFYGTHYANIVDNNRFIGPIDTLGMR